MPCCDSHCLMSTPKNLARLVAVCSKEQPVSFEQRQIPINIDEHLIVKMKLQFAGSCLTSHQRGMKKNCKAYATFLKNYKRITCEEMERTLRVSISQIKEYIPRCVPCLGCRTSLDHFIKTLVQYRHQALEPIILDENNSFTLNKSQYSSPDSLYSLFYIPGAKVDSFIESIPKCKKNRRCHIHSLDKTKFIHDWQTVWEMMDKECRDEITLVESGQLLDVLETYLHKHRFCAECKLKVLEAYDLLLDNHNPKHRERKGFCPALYQGIQPCSNDRHIHIQSDQEFIGSLIARAELEMEDSRRERHAKTLDIAQEEILTCLGIYLYERFEKIDRVIRSEEQTWQLLFYIIVDCLRLNFEMVKEDFNVTLKILCEEFSVNDQVKRQKKPKRNKKKSQRTTTTISEIENSVDDPEESRIAPRRNHSCSRSERSYPSRSLMKSQSCPAIFSPPVEHKLPLSSSLETLFSSVSTRDCVCQAINSQKQPSSSEECPTLSCIRCSSTRTDLGYSSELDDAWSSGLCDCSSTTCVACLTDCKNGCPLHKCNESVLSNEIGTNNSTLEKTVTNCTKTIELCDITRKPKLKLQLSDQYPFFNMDLKETWDGTLSNMMEETSFISDDDLREFFVLHSHLELKRAQLRKVFQSKFQIWQEQTASRS